MPAFLNSCQQNAARLLTLDKAASLEEARQRVKFAQAMRLGSSLDTSTVELARLSRRGTRNPLPERTQPALWQTLFVDNALGSAVVSLNVLAVSQSGPSREYLD